MKTTRHTDTTVLIETEELFIHICTGRRVISAGQPSMDFMEPFNDEVLRFDKMKVQNKINGFFFKKAFFSPFPKFFFVLLPHLGFLFLFLFFFLFFKCLFLNGARLHLDLLLRLRRLRLLVADVGTHRHQGAAAVQGVQEVPRLLGDLAGVGSLLQC